MVADIRRAGDVNHCEHIKDQYLDHHLSGEEMWCQITLSKINTWIMI